MILLHVMSQEKERKKERRSSSFMTTLEVKTLTAACMGRIREKEEGLRLQGFEEG
jgi:hypothetical protein